MARKPVAVEELNEEQAAAELAKLAREIAEHDKRYFQHDAPTISDAAYDALRQRGGPTAVPRGFVQPRQPHHKQGLPIAPGARLFGQPHQRVGAGLAGFAGGNLQFEDPPFAE